jgi:hypothetical protein
MNVTIGTFNLNNLFSRYNFTGEIEALKDEKTAVEAEYVYRFGSTDRLKIRKYRGKLVQRKDAEDTRGDMNDAPDSSYLTFLTSNAGLELTNALTDPKETRPTKESKYPPSGPAWTHRYKQKAATCSMNSTTRSGSVHRSPRGRLVPGFIAVKISPAMDPTMIRHGLS